MNFGEFLLYTVSYFGLFTAIFFMITLLENRKQIYDKMPKKFPYVTIIVPAYNEEKRIERTIESLLELDYPKNKIELMVVDDGSTDNTLKVLEQYGKKIIVFSKHNEGKGKALNYAIKRSKGEFVGALDADSYVDKKALKRIISHFNNPQIMAVTPSMKVGNARSLLQKIQQIEYLMGIFLRKIFAFLGSIHVTPGPFTIYRKKFFEKYGYFDHTTITEDIEIALRIQSKNYIIENSVNAYVYTIAPDKFKPLLQQRLRWYRGFLDNVVKYKHLFSKRFGNLGLFILPASFASVALIIMAVGYSLIKLLSNQINTLVNWYNINFDLKSLLTFKIDFFLLSFNAVFVLILLSTLVGISMIMIAKFLSEEQTKIKFSYFYYVLLYSPLFALWWIVAIYYKVRNKKIKWGQRLM
ncbi:glycosyltransferase family 2 protein [Candidatus Woesearchaeota archaeon]|nr:glycosyltransferase family 2 protein [Candidatus Woesearchaeota archaeon]